MIIEYIGNAIYNLFNSIITFSIPTYDTNLVDNIMLFWDYIMYGIDFIKYIIPSYGAIIISIILVIKGAVLLYFGIMWIIKKIPMLNIH